MEKIRASLSACKSAGISHSSKQPAAPAKSKGAAEKEKSPPTPPGQSINLSGCPSSWAKHQTRTALTKLCPGTSAMGEDCKQKGPEED